MKCVHLLIIDGLYYCEFFCDMTENLDCGGDCHARTSNEDCLH